MISLSLNQLKLIAENRGIKDYENKPEELIKYLANQAQKLVLRASEENLMNREIGFLSQK